MQASLTHKTSWKMFKLQAVVTCMGQVCTHRKGDYFNMHSLRSCVSSSLLQIFPSDFPNLFAGFEWEGLMVWFGRVKPEISSPKRNFPDSSAGTRCCVSCVMHSLTYNSASLVIFEKDNFCSCYPREILPSASGENNVV